MNINVIKIVLSVFVAICVATPVIAQDVLIPDAGLDAAIRQKLQKATETLTVQDMLALTNLDASRRNVKSLAGLEFARNLSSLDLQINRLTNAVVPAELTLLTILNLSGNSLTNCTLPDTLTNLSILSLEANQLTGLTVPPTLTRLNSLDLANNQFARFDALSNLTDLIFVDLSFNSFTNFVLPGTLTNLTTLVFEGNPATEIIVPPGLAGITELHLSQNLMTSFRLPAGMTNLLFLDLFFNRLTNFALPNDLNRLGGLDLDNNELTSLNLPENLTRLASLEVRSNLLTVFSLPPDMKALTFLDMGENQLTNVTLPGGLNHLETLRLSGNPNLTSLIVPPGLTNLTGMFLRFNHLMNLVLPPDLGNLVQIDVLGNNLASLALPAGLSNLVTLVLSGNQLTNLTLPPEITKLSSLVLNGNPLETFVVPEGLAAGNLAEDIVSLKNSGISVFTYPLSIKLLRPRSVSGAFSIGITGPPGTYSVVKSTNLSEWTFLRTTEIPLGAIAFSDAPANLEPTQFYRAFLQASPSNMVFIAPNTFTMGSPIDELHRQPNEGPQTIVTLTHGFWIGKYEVTQAEYLAVTGENPSFFPGDLSRPISSVSWPAATNYCYLLTQRELAAGRIPDGSQYRLPSEAEWECAARAGTTTRFSYGNDTNYANLGDYAWYNGNSRDTVHTVGQKLPNPWGLYDTEGNVWEWCQDWLGDLPGGTVVDPQGPPSNAIGWKIVRGGSYDGETDCRSARRYFFGNHPALTDTTIGFRVVFVPAP